MKWWVRHGWIPELRRSGTHLNTGGQVEQAFLGLRSAAAFEMLQLSRSLAKLVICESVDALAFFAAV